MKGLHPRVSGAEHNDLPPCESYFLVVIVVGGRDDEQQATPSTPSAALKFMYVCRSGVYASLSDTSTPSEFKKTTRPIAVLNQRTRAIKGPSTYLHTLYVLTGTE